MQDIQQHTTGHLSPTLSGMLAQQRQGDVARAAERRRVVTIALANGSANAPRAPRTPGASAWGRLTSIGAALTRARDARPTYGDVACCV